MAYRGNELLNAFHSILITLHERRNAGSHTRHRKKQQMNILIDQMRDTNITLSEF